MKINNNIIFILKDLNNFGNIKNQLFKILFKAFFTINKNFNNIKF